MELTIEKCIDILKIESIEIYGKICFREGREWHGVHGNF